MQQVGIRKFFRVTIRSFAMDQRKFKIYFINKWKWTGGGTGENQSSKPLRNERYLWDTVTAEVPKLNEAWKLLGRVGHKWESEIFLPNFVSDALKWLWQIFYTLCASVSTSVIQITANLVTFTSQGHRKAWKLRSTMWLRKHNYQKHEHLGDDQ